jgi:hypothetical protein
VTNAKVSKMVINGLDSPRPCFVPARGGVDSINLKMIFENSIAYTG